MQEHICICIPDSHPHRITSTKRRKNTVVSPDDRHIAARNLYRLINIPRINCAARWFYLQDYTEMHGRQKIKIVLMFCFMGNIISSGGFDFNIDGIRANFGKKYEACSCTLQTVENFQY